MGHGARIKMFHALRANLANTDCPYELVVVGKDQIHGGDYYTISASGVVQVFGAAPAEFTPIGDWVREHSVFNMMKQVRRSHTSYTLIFLIEIS